VRGLPVGDDSDAFRVVTLTTDTPGGAVAINVAVSLAAVQRSVRTLTTGLLVGGPALLALVGAMTWLLVGRALRPVEAMRTQVADISARDLDRRVPEPWVDDEIGRLARTMNAMLDRLQPPARTSAVSWPTPRTSFAARSRPGARNSRSRSPIRPTRAGRPRRPDCCGSTSRPRARAAGRPPAPPGRQLRRLQSADLDHEHPRSNGREPPGT